ncbi:hypothetical protein GYH30_004526 [Glycine max]|nr:hypothetical protein GYH30_004526 [Glycine max]
MTRSYYCYARHVEIVKLSSNSYIQVLDVGSKDSKETLPIVESPRTKLKASYTFPPGTRCPLVLETSVEEATLSITKLRALESEEDNERTSHDNLP